MGVEGAWDEGRGPDGDGAGDCQANRVSTIPETK